MKIILLLITLIIFSSNIVYGLSLGDLTNEENLNKWKPTIENSSELEGKAETILGYINAVGVVLSVVILSVLGIKYMMGSVEEKATYKQTMIPYFIGALLLFSATTLPNVIYKCVEQLGLL